ncbi:MAG: spermidine synthase, partial [Bdellovibrionales bacterium]|nr:spermidine synthase [Bdellovibrionales bacterium]
LAAEFDNPRLELVIGDGIEFVAKAKPESYDLIVVDGSDPVGPAEGLFTADFYRSCHRALKKGGIVVAQGESPMFMAKAFQQLNGCLKGIFGKESVHTYLFFIPTYPSGMWSFQMARKGAPHPINDVDAGKIAAFSHEHRLHYYNEGVHQAAFQLPGFVRQMLSE